MESNLKTMKYFVRAALVAALIVAGATGHVQAQSAALQSAVFDNEITAADVTCYTFNSNLTVGSQGGDVMALQIFLAQKGLLTLPAGQTPNINSYFGRLTKAAVAKYQSTVGINPSGYVGPLTRGRINTEFACSEGATSPVGNENSNSSDQSSEESRLRGYAAVNNAALIVGKPTITLERGINNEETSLAARFEVLVTPSLKDGDLTLIGQQNYIYFEGKAGDGGQVRSLSTQVIPGKNVTTSKNEYGQTTYTVASNSVGRLTLVGRVNTKELFAGPYRARVTSTVYARQGSSQDAVLQVVNASNKVTDQVRVMGEVSPYVSSVKVDTENASVQIKGVRFSTNNTNKITIYPNGSAAKTFVVHTESSSYLSFPAPYLPSSTDGSYAITVTNNELGDVAGLSNTIGFNYNGTVGTSNATYSSQNEGRLVDVGSDYVSSTSFGPGTGTYNQTKNDWHWAVRLVNDSDKTIRSLTLLTYDRKEGWSTASNVTVKAGNALPLKVMTSSFTNSKADEMIPVSKGTTVMNLWGQVESTGFPGGTLIVSYADGSGAQINIPGSDLRSGSSGNVTVNTTNTTQTVVPAVAVAPSGITVEAHVVDAGSDYVGYWGVWKPGTGNVNKSSSDWHWAARIVSPKAAVVKTVTITNAFGEGWSTSDSAKVGGVLTYPLKFRSATQENTGPNGKLSLNEGSTVVNFWGQIETAVYAGGTITLTLEDGSTVSASIPASSVPGQQSTTTVTPSTVTTNSTTAPAQSPSSIPPQTQAAVAPAQDSVEAHVVDAGSDYVGIWGNWKPGRGNVNPTNKDWHWAARLVTGAAKTIQSVTVTNGTEAWSTAELQVAGIPAYPLKFMSAYKTNTVANDRFDVSAGATVFNLWGQIESSTFSGGTIRIVFTDGSSVAAQIPASPIKPATESVTSATVFNSNITEGIVSASVTSGRPGTKVVLKLAGVKTAPTVGDFNFGSYGLSNYSYNASSNEVSFTVPADAPVGTYEIVWFGPTSSYVVKFSVVPDTTTFSPSASELVGSVINVLKSLF